MSELDTMQDIEPRLDIVRGYLQEDIDNHVFSGATVALLTPTSTHFIEEGTTNYGNSEAFDRKSLVDLASVTKSLTATAFLRLIQQPGNEQLLKRNISEFLPALKTDIGDGSKITIEDLLTMNVEWKLGRSMSEITREILAEPISDEEKKKRFTEMTLNTEIKKRPEGEHTYQDASFIALGWILESYYAQRGRPLTYEQIMKELVFNPLGMTSATLHPDPARCVAMGVRDGVTIQGIPHDPKATLAPGHAGIFCSGEDLAKFVRMIVHHGNSEDSEKPFLSPASYALLTTKKTLDENRGWWTMGLRLYEKKGPGHDHWYGGTAKNALCSNGFTGQHFVIFEDNTAVIFLNNYHMPHPGEDREGDRLFTTLQQSRKRILQELTNQ